MNRITTPYALAFLFALLPLALGAQYRAEARLDSTSIRVGDPLRLRLDLWLPPGAKPGNIGIDTLDAVSDIERRKTTPLRSEQSPSGTHYIQEFTLTAFDTGYFRLPPIPVEILEKGTTTRITTNDLALRVRSTLPEGGELRPIKDIVREPLRLSDFWWLGALLLLLIAGYALYRRLRRPAPMPVVAPAPPRPPHEIALEKLTALAASDYLFSGNFKTYQSELTHIFREYLSLRHGYNALEATTDEIEHQFSNWEVPEDWKGRLSQILRRADLVKFAKGELSAEEHREGLEQVRRFVQATAESQ